jgi:hypothetical protein
VRLETIRERKNEVLKKFKNKLDEIESQRAAWRQREKKARNAYQNVYEKRRNLLAMGDTVSAEQLNARVEKLKNEWLAIAAESMESEEDMKTLVANTPESKLHKWAEKAVKLANSEAAKLDSKALDLLDREIPKKKSDYFASVRKLNETFKMRFAAANDIIKLQKYLPKDKRNFKAPGIVAPNTGSLEIGADEISKVYKRQSVVTLSK